MRISNFYCRFNVFVFRTDGATVRNKIKNFRKFLSTFSVTQMWTHCTSFPSERLIQKSPLASNQFFSIKKMYQTTYQYNHPLFLLRTLTFSIRSYFYFINHCFGAVDSCTNPPFHQFWRNFNLLLKITLSKGKRITFCMM